MFSLPAKSSLDILTLKPFKYKICILINLTLVLTIKKWNIKKTFKNNFLKIQIQFLHTWRHLDSPWLWCLGEYWGLSWAPVHGLAPGKPGVWGSRGISLSQDGCCWLDDKESSPIEKTMTHHKHSNILHIYSKKHGHIRGLLLRNFQ